MTGRSRQGQLGESEGGKQRKIATFQVGDDGGQSGPIELKAIVNWLAKMTCASTHMWNPVDLFIFCFSSSKEFGVEFGADVVHWSASSVRLQDRDCEALALDLVKLGLLFAYWLFLRVIILFFNLFMYSLILYDWQWNIGTLDPISQFCSLILKVSDLISQFFIKNLGSYILNATFVH